MSVERLSVTRRIAVPASRVFDLVSDPAGHVAIDGSGMLEAAPAAARLSEVGQTFDVDMDRAPLNDIPGMGKYKVRNTVTALVPNKLVEWSVSGVDRPPVGHVYGWQIDDDGDDACRVTNYCDWSGITDEYRNAREWPIVPSHMLEKSLDNLERLVTSS